MLLGHCRFDIEKEELINLDSGDVWHLPRAELQVLTLLVDYQGKVVAKALLKAGNGEHPPLSDSSVTRAVFTLRSFLGPQYESLIETVKGQGYLLRHHRCRKRNTPASLYYLSAAKLLIGIPLAVIIASVCIWAIPSQSELTSPAPVPLHSNSVKTLSGHPVNIILYAHSKTNNRLLTQLGQTMLDSFSQCQLSSWKNVYLSLSHDKQVLNITLRGEQFGQSIIRNLKISDLRQPKQFINQQWLQAADICG